MSTGDFRVADISLADFGRKEIEIAEHEVGKNLATKTLSINACIPKVASYITSILQDGSI
jgi:hypothetical protein